MHPYLRLSSLNALPISVRRLALAACAADCSMNDIFRVSSAMDRAQDDGEGLLKFLPVFYAFLDPLRIPTSDQLDAMSPSTSCVIEAAILALDAIFTPDTPPETRVDLWPRVWVWVDFLHTFRDNLRGVTEQSEEDLYVDFILFAAAFTQSLTAPLQLDASIVALMRETRGFVVVLFRAWTVAFKIPDTETRERALVAVSMFLMVVARDPLYLPEMLDTVGGSSDKLAVLFVRHISRVAPTGQAKLTPTKLQLLVRIFPIMEALNKNLPSLIPALASNELAKVLTDAILALIRTNLPNDTRPDPASTFYMSVTFLTMVLLTPEGYRVVTEAIQHGLLRAIVTCGHGRIPKEISKHLEYLLTDILAPATVRYYLLEEIRDAIAQLDDTVSSPSFQKSEIFKAWSTFAAVTTARVEVAREFDSDFVSQRACDYPKCRVISEKINFKRCSGCFTLFYCSKACQSLDWRQGGHLGTCAMYRARHINVHRHYTPRERAFLRALLASDFDTARGDIYRDISFGSVMRPGTEWFTLFDYTRGRVTVETLPLSAAHEKMQIDAAYWADQVARARASGGRMALHVMLVRDGEEAQALTAEAPRAHREGRGAEFMASALDFEIPEGTVEIH
ncbi:hypothetical protein DFH06DRAFT_1226206 [Mycena polygramma]|nr:hypothetical protein DFH06DRAFT_1226206 [Mycena polygramma]